MNVIQHVHLHLFHMLSNCGLVPGTSLILTVAYAFGSAFGEGQTFPVLQFVVAHQKLVVALVIEMWELLVI